MTTTRRHSTAGRWAVILAVVNATITLLVLMSPIGVGEGSDLIGNSGIRLLVMILLQAPIAVGGTVAAFRARLKGQNWLPALIANVLVIPLATLFLYFAQSRTIERFL